MSNPLTVVADAARIIRQRAEAANTDEARRPYGDRTVDPFPEAEWGRLVDNYLGGELATHCAAWTPAAAIAVSKHLADFVADYEVVTEAPECPSCDTGYCRHAPVTYHVECDEPMEQCKCLRPYVELATTYLDTGGTDG